MFKKKYLSHEYEQLLFNKKNFLYIDFYFLVPTVQSGLFEKQKNSSNIISIVKECLKTTIE